MSKNPAKRAKPSSTVSANTLDLRIDASAASALKEVCGSDVEAFNQDLLNALLRTAWLPKGLLDPNHHQTLTAMVAAMKALGPADEIEALIAGQALAMHAASMEASRRAMIPEQPFEVAQGYRKAAANSSRTFIELLAALDRRRGRASQQQVRVEHVHISPGAQAIVGNITPTIPGDGGIAGKTQAEPRAQAAALAHDIALGSCQPTMWRTDAERATLPGAGDERHLPMRAARRKIDRTEDA
jgi:hypothetical protein